MRTSRLNDEERLRQTVKRSQCLSDVLREFGFHDPYRGSSNFKTLRSYLRKFEIDCSHFNSYTTKSQKNSRVTITKSLQDILLGKHPTYSTNDLKHRLYREGYKKPICEECGQLPLWNNKPLVLTLDHINGICDDHRLENLKVLCPHCHSQTDTFAGRNKRKRV